MEQIHFERLQKLADHLMSGELGHEVFSFRELNAGKVNRKGCGTVGCEMGELPEVFPQDWRFRKYENGGEWIPLLKTFKGEVFRTASFECAEEYFGISDPEALHLFVPFGQSPESYGGQHLNSEATREEVAQNLYAFISIKKNNRNETII